MDWSGIANDPSIPNNPNVSGGSSNNNNNNNPPPSPNKPTVGNKGEEKKKSKGKNEQNQPQTVNLNSLDIIERKALECYNGRYGETDKDEKEDSDEEGSDEEEKSTKLKTRGKGSGGSPGNTSPSSMIDYSRDPMYLRLYKRFIVKHITREKALRNYASENGLSTFTGTTGTHKCIAKVQVEGQLHVYKRCWLVATDRPYITSDDQKGPLRYCPYHANASFILYDTYKDLNSDVKVQCNAAEGYYETKKKIDGVERVWCLRRTDKYLFFWELDPSASMDMSHNTVINYAMDSYRKCYAVFSKMPVPETKLLTSENVKSSALQISTDLARGVVLNPVPSQEDIEEVERKKKEKQRKKKEQEKAKKKKKKQQQQQVENVVSPTGSGTRTPASGKNENIIDLDEYVRENKVEVYQKLKEMSVKSQRQHGIKGIVTDEEVEQLPYEFMIAFDSVLTPGGAYASAFKNLFIAKEMEQKLLNLSRMIGGIINEFSNMFGPDGKCIGSRYYDLLAAQSREWDSFDIEKYLEAYLDTKNLTFTREDRRNVFAKSRSLDGPGKWQFLSWMIPFEWFDDTEYDTSRYLTMKFGVVPNAPGYFIEEYLVNHSLWIHKIEVDNTEKGGHIKEFFMHPFMRLARTLSLMGTIFYMIPTYAGFVSEAGKELSNKLLSGDIDTAHGVEAKVAKLDIFVDEVRQRCFGHAVTALVGVEIACKRIVFIDELIPQTSSSNNNNNVGLPKGIMLDSILGLELSLLDSSIATLRAKMLMLNTINTKNVVEYIEKNANGIKELLQVYLSTVKMGTHVFSGVPSSYMLMDSAETYIKKYLEIGETKEEMDYMSESERKAFKNNKIRVINRCRKLFRPEGFLKAIFYYDRTKEHIPWNIYKYNLHPHEDAGVLNYSAGTLFNPAYLNLNSITVGKIVQKLAKYVDADIRLRDLVVHNLDDLNEPLGVLIRKCNLILFEKNEAVRHPDITKFGTSLNSLVREFEAYDDSTLIQVITATECPPSTETIDDREFLSTLASYDVREKSFDTIHIIGYIRRVGPAGIILLNKVIERIRGSYSLVENDDFDEDQPEDFDKNPRYVMVLSARKFTETFDRMKKPYVTPLNGILLTETVSLRENEESMRPIENSSMFRTLRNMARSSQLIVTLFHSIETLLAYTSVWTKGMMENPDTWVPVTTKRNVDLSSSSSKGKKEASLPKTVSSEEQTKRMTMISVVELLENLTLLPVLADTITILRTNEIPYNTYSNRAVLVIKGLALKVAKLKEFLGSDRSCDDINKLEKEDPCGIVVRMLSNSGILRIQHMIKNVIVQRIGMKPTEFTNDEENKVFNLFLSHIRQENVIRMMKTENTVSQLVISTRDKANK